jgi:hypothetical protein
MGGADRNRWRSFALRNAGFLQKHAPERGAAISLGPYRHYISAAHAFGG